MKLPRNGRILAGSVFAALSLQGCQEAASLDTPTSPEAPRAAARATMPNNLANITPWVLSDYETITYYLEGTYSTNAINRASAVEAFKEWSLVFQDNASRIRFQETTDRDFANIRVAYGTSLSGGCVEGTRVRYCDLFLPNASYLLKGIGMVMGIPVSANAGDVMNAPSSSSIFSANDLSQVNSKYSLMYYKIVPMFEVPYYNSTGTEVVMGWEALRSRSIPTSVYVKKNLSDRKLVAGAIAAGHVSAWENVATYAIPAYVKSANYSNSKFISYWNHAQWDYSSYHSAGLKGGDPTTPVLGYAGCADYSVAPATDFGSSNQLFGFNPELVWIGGYPYHRASAAKFAPGTTVPVYFYKDVATNRYRVSTTLPTTNATCVRLGGYGLAVN